MRPLGRLERGGTWLKGAACRSLTSQSVTVGEREAGRSHVHTENQSKSSNPQRQVLDSTFECRVLPQTQFPNQWSVSALELFWEGRQVPEAGLPDPPRLCLRCSHFQTCHITATASSSRTTGFYFLSCILRSRSNEMTGRCRYPGKRERPTCRARSRTRSFKKIKSVMNQCLWFDYHQGK